MLNVNVYHPTPVISGPIALINPHSTPNKKKKKKKRKRKKKKNKTHQKPKTHNVAGTQGSNQNIAN